ncbi:MAG: hypothetical protein HQ541_07675 [Mariniphaga sp.]|nr:hypothetical protein [Mariniphaga sp.]
MKIFKKICCTAFFVLEIGIAYSQPDVKIDSTQNLKLMYYGAGGSIIGGSLGMSFTTVRSNNSGVCISFESNYQKAENIPHGREWELITGPNDKIHAISLRMVKELPTNSNKVRFGFETGPSFMLYKKAKFRIQESYFLWFPITYTNKSYDQKYTVGLSFKAKIEFPVLPFAGTEVTLNANLNGYQSYLSLDLYLTLGRVRN